MTISTADMVVDVETVVCRLGLQTLAVVGHSMGGVVAGAYGTAHPGVPVVSIDGFAGGVATVGTDADQQALRRMMDRARISLRSMTAAPEEGDENWKSEQIDAVNARLDAMGYRPAHREAMVLRQFALSPGRPLATAPVEQDRRRRRPRGLWRPSSGDHHADVPELCRAGADSALYQERSSDRRAGCRTR